MAFPDRFLDELIERSEITDVVSTYVQLTQKGSNLFGLCPFHNEKTPSFSVSASKQMYHCFGCGKGGGVINFIMNIENLSFQDAVYFLAGRAGMTVPETGDEDFSRKRKRLLDLNRSAARYFNALLKEDAGAAALSYMEKRLLSKAIATRFGLGAAPDSWDSLITAMSALGYDKRELIEAGLAVAGSKGRIYDKFRNRLMFPVIDVRGDVLGFGGRSLGNEEPKYLNSPETILFSKRRVLYGMNLAKNTKRSNIILCEGNIDVITLHQAGFDNAVASMGTSLTVDQTRLIARYVKEIVLCYDNDEAGKKATDRALGILRNSEFSVKVINLPNKIVDGKKMKLDVDDYIKAYGRDAFEKLLKGSENHIAYHLAALQEQYDLSQNEQKVEFLKQAVDMISKLSSPVEREVYGARAAEVASITCEAMKQEVDRAFKRRLSESRKARARQDTRPVSSAQPRQRSIRYQNIVSASAEEGIVRLLFLDPSLIPNLEIKPEEFSSPFLGKVFTAVLNRYAEGKSLSLASFSQTLTDEEMSGLSEILEKPEALSEAERSMKDYITVIRTETLKSTADLMAISEKMRERKGYGG
jgi:DNA primase